MSRRFPPPPSPCAGLDLTARLSEVLAASLADAGRQQGGDPPALALARSPRPLAPQRMAMAHPARDRERAASMYGRCLAHYRSTLEPDGPTPGTDDLGAALAHFTTANLQALSDDTVPAEAWPVLRRQLCAVVRSSPAWRRALPRDRQAYVEQLGILAVLMADLAARAKREGADAVAHLRRGARGYLRQLLGVDADAVTIGAGGLALRPGLRAA